MENGTNTTIIIRFYFYSLLCVSLFFYLPLYAEAPHSLWYFEQIAEPIIFHPSPSTDPRALSLPIQNEEPTGLIASATNYQNAFSFLGVGIVDIHNYEISIKGSQRFYHLLSTTKVLETDFLTNQLESFSIELGRLFVNKNNHFGRFVVEAIELFPSSHFWGRIGMSTGALATPSVPWQLLLNSSFIAGLNNQIINVSTQVARRFYGSTQNLHSKKLTDGYIGLTMSFSYRMHSKDLIPGADIPIENILISFAPTLEFYLGYFGALKIMMPIRIWMDVASVQTSTQTVNAFPSFIDLPALWVQYQITI